MKNPELLKPKSPYIHGGEPERDLKRFGIKFTEVLDFSVNISPLGPPESLLNSWNTLVAEVDKYPSLNGDGIVRYYQERFGLSEDSLLAGNGSTEMVYLVPRVLNLKNGVVLTPSFYDYTRSLQLAGAQVTTLPFSIRNGIFIPQLQNIKQALKQADSLFLGNPNNPTGTLFPKMTLLELAKEFPDKWFLVDEAFIQYADSYEKSSLLTEKNIPENLLVFHSLTKFFALPGLRMGCLIGQRETIKRIRHYKEPWTVNRIAEKAATTLSSCDQYETEVMALIKKERKRVFEKFLKIDGITVFQSHANFFLAKWERTDNLDDLLGYLLSKGVYVRDCRNFPELEENYFRFAIRRPEENNLLTDLLTSADKNV